MKVLFIHGLASSGAYKTATTLHSLLSPCEVIAPDVPIDPDEAFEMLSRICITQKPDLIVGLSLGGFWAQKLRGYRKILINPGLRASEFMKTLPREVQYLSPRRNGDKSFTLTEEIISRYADLEDSQFEGITELDRAQTRGMFATGDELVHSLPEFERHYPGCAITYPGAHLPTHPELKQWLLPLALELLDKQ